MYEQGDFQISLSFFNSFHLNRKCLYYLQIIDSESGWVECVEIFRWIAIIIMVYCSGGFSPIINFFLMLFFLSLYFRLEIIFLSYDNWWLCQRQTALLHRIWSDGKKRPSTRWFYFFKKCFQSKISQDFLLCFSKMLIIKTKIRIFSFYNRNGYF